MGDRARIAASLPGISLTIGAMELCQFPTHIGASRLMYGIAQLALLIFGVGLGLEIAARCIRSHRRHKWKLVALRRDHCCGNRALHIPSAQRIVGLADGSDRRRLVGQEFAEKIMSVSHSGFVGAILSVPFSMLASRIKTSPPAAVSDARVLLGVGARGIELRIAQPGGRRRQLRDRRPGLDCGGDSVHRAGNAGRVEHLPHHRRPVAWLQVMFRGP